MNTSPRNRQSAIVARLKLSTRGITAIELLATVAVLLFVGLLLFPVTRNHNKAHPLTSCGSQMKQIALAFIVWCNDQEAAGFPARVPVAQGGLLHHPNANDLTVQFAHLSNELVSPKVLACPSDREVRVADSFGADRTAREAGLLHPKLRNNAISYVLNVDIGIGTNGAALPLEQAGNQIMVTDRNLRPGQIQASVCSSAITNALRVAVGKSQTPGFATARAFGHGAIANVALGDGSVTKSASGDLVSFLQPAEDPTGVHFMYPRNPAFDR